MRELMHGDLATVLKGSPLSPTSIDINALEQRQSSDTDPEPNYDPTDPYTMLVYNQQNQVAAKLIGIFANQNTNHAFASSMDVFELNEPIAFCGKSLSDLLHKGNPEEAAEIDLNMAEFLAASVDAVKDPVLNFLNLNTLTADAGALLARLGYTTKEIGLLFNQPIIRQICEDSFNRGVRMNTAIDDAVSKLMTHLTGYDSSKQVPLTEQELAMGIVKERMALEKGQTQDDFIASDAQRQMQMSGITQPKKVTVGNKVDTTVVVKDGKFEVNVPVDLTTLSRVRFDRSIYSFISDGSKITLNLKDGKAYSNQKKGVHSKYVEYNKWTGDFKADYARRIEQIGDDQAAVDACFKEMLPQYNDYLKATIKANKDNVLGAIALSQYGSDDPKEVMSLINSLSPKIQQHPEVAALKKAYGTGNK
jgi:hypothetical protein